MSALLGLWPWLASALGVALTYFLGRSHGASAASRRDVAEAEKKRQAVDVAIAHTEAAAELARQTEDAAVVADESRALAAENADQNATDLLKRWGR